MSRMKPSKKKKFDEYRDYMSNAFSRERTFLKTLDLVYGVTTYVDRWLSDMDAKRPLPVLCYTNILPSPENISMFGDLTTAQRIALNAETIGLFEDRDYAMMILSQELSYRKSFFQSFIQNCDDDQPVGDVCIVDEKDHLLVSVKPIQDPELEPRVNEENTFIDEANCEEDSGGAGPGEGMKRSSPATSDKLDLILYLVSPYLTCEDKILLDVAIEDSLLRESPFVRAIDLCGDGIADAIADISVDIYTDIKRNRSHSIVGSPYIGWIFGKSYTTNHYFPRVPGTLSIYNKCICGTSLRHLYQRKSYKRLRGIARNLDDLPMRRGRTVLGYSFVHTLTM